MPHPLEDYRDRFTSLLDEVEQIIGEVEELRLDIDGIYIPGVGLDGRLDARYGQSGGVYTCYTLGGLEQAQSTLQDAISAMDDWEAPIEDEPEEEDLEEEDDEEEDEDA
jgi:hypothetical protein